MQQNHTKLGTHHYMLVLLLLIEENTKGTISEYSLACDIFLLLYLFSSFVLVFFLSCEPWTFSLSFALIFFYRKIKNNILLFKNNIILRTKSQ